MCKSVFFVYFNQCVKNNISGIHILVHNIIPSVTPLTVFAFSNADITNSDVSKGVAARYLCDYFNIDYTKTMAVGDSDNDISMLDICTNSFCMDHSDDEVKKHAAFIVSSVKDAVELFDK